MGITKRMMEQQEALKGAALRILVDASVLEECEVHDGYYYEGGIDVEEAYKLANARITRGEVELPEGVSRRDFTDIIKEAREENWATDSCTYCDHIMSKD